MASTAITQDIRAGVGPLLRDWRRRRRLSQLDLALEAGISARHLSFVETGRSKPSAEMVLRLAEQLDVPLRERNQLLLAGGWAPAYEERDLEAPELAPVHDAIQRVLDGHDPYPALVVDRHWNLVAANHSVALLTAGVAPELLRPPLNAMRLALHPGGLAPRIVNHGEWRAHLLERLARQVAVTGDSGLQALLEEVVAHPAPGGDDEGDAAAPPAPSGHDLAGRIAVPLRLRIDGGELQLISIVSTFGTATDVTVAELSIEAFFPADEQTAALLRARAA
ncbi:helix-turn-helix transcriptional regulator [Conexibacter sp. JD483]|uniref:helix-turn-helix transcriptional regulator n=1 Tax=unclassified Conexibacter TaxID=2627773 RepID=UPI00272474FA|nr:MULTISPECIES: helix-turn-helix transcriptional regulator [unclassified Conexibacter]MDO8188250.1 helix-turn-helix transcriptional regulator [Conexibacter sp. CPCC 205706]MDO8197395.1 helix-turn-helix transcriptional regulator [Conexibacter sp. CPCC 205762]MDR9370171.1 helix-turn-helix transcriptional regulator [Conexibacter sp. JD483]